MSTGYFDNRTKLELDDLFSGLITANHILHKQNVLDAYGHISVRNPDNPETFFIAHSVAPALVSSADELIEFKVADGSPAEEGKEIGWSERYIHSEIYKRFPAVNSVVHSHCSDVLPFAASHTALKPVIHMASFLGPSVPVWDISKAYSSSDTHDLLVRDTKTGHALALAMDKAATSVGFISSKLSSGITSLRGGKEAEPSGLPDHPVCLMRGHGFAAAGRGIEEVVYMAVYTREAAKALSGALAISRASGEAHVEGSVEQGSGKIKNGKAKWDDSVSYLSDRECQEGWATMRGSVLRPWKMWSREVETTTLYVNNARKESK